MKAIGKYGMIVGPDGSGKSTIAKMLTEDTFNLPLALVREPGGTPLGEKVRGLFMTFDHLPAAVKFYLMSSTRAMLKPTIEQLLEERHVISDRGFPCTYAFQICGEEAHELEGLYWQTVASESILKPDFIVILDVDVKVGAERMRLARGDVGIKEFDEAGVAFKERVRSGYREFKAKYFAPKCENGLYASTYIVDASMSLPDVYARVRAICAIEFSTKSP